MKPCCVTHMETEAGLISCGVCGAWSYVPGYRPSYQEAYNSLTRGDGLIFALWQRQNPGYFETLREVAPDCDHSEEAA